VAKYRVFFTTTADATVRMEIDDAELAELMSRTRGGRDLEMSDAGTVVDNAVWDNDPDTPRMCAHCAGWGKKYSLDLGDEWEITGIETIEDDES